MDLEMKIKKVHAPETDPRLSMSIHRYAAFP
jgi:hypothetical protein